MNPPRKQGTRPCSETSARLIHGISGCSSLGKDGGELWGTQMLADPLRSSLRRHRSSRSSRLGDSRGIFVTADHSAIVDVLQVETVFLFVVTVMSIILDPLVS